MPRSRYSLVRTGRPHVQAPRPSSRPEPKREEGRDSASLLTRAGNRAMGRLIGGRGASLRVGGVADRFEAEAKALSGRRPLPGRLPHAPGLSGVGSDGGGRVRDDIAERIRGMRGGQPLPHSVKSPLEAKHRTGLGGIRIHTGPEAEALTSAVGARAMTLDHNIFYGRGASPKDMSLTSEEVGHTMQQGAVPAGKPMGRSPKGVIQRDITLTKHSTTKKKVRKNYWGKFDDVNMTFTKIMTPDSKKPLGTVGMGPCAGLVVAAETPKGWVAGLHHAAGGTANLPKIYKSVRADVLKAAEPYGTVSREVRYLIPGSETKDALVTKFEDEVGLFDNNWRAMKAGYASGTSSIAVTIEKIKKWQSAPGLGVKYWQVR